MEKYYALLDNNLGGFKAGYADTKKTILLDDAAQFLIEMAGSDEEQQELEKLEREEILERNNFEIVEVTCKTFNEVLASTQYHHSSVV